MTTNAYRLTDALRVLAKKWRGAIPVAATCCHFGKRDTYAICARDIEKALAEHDAQPAPAPVQVDGFDAEPGLPWRDISECEPSDDLYWFMRGDVIDGPRTPASDDPDYWSHFAPCEAPPFNRTAHPPAPAADGAGELEPLMIALESAYRHGRANAPFATEDCVRKTRAAIAALRQPNGDDLAEQFRLGYEAGQAALRQPVPDAVRELPIAPVEVDEFEKPAMELTALRKKLTAAEDAARFAGEACDDNERMHQESRATLILAAIASQQESRND